jgi:acylphosphatase
MEREMRHLLNMVVSGRVQEVGFRYFAAHRARAHGIAGWVKNRYDGKVEIEAEGARDDLELFLAEIRNGPSASYVTHVSEAWREISKPVHDGFSIAY